jgi:hypothetical protein
MDIGVAHGAGGVEGVTWGTTEVGAPHGGWPKSVKQVTKELRRAWWSDRLGSQSDWQPLYGGGLTIWAHGLNISLCSEGGLTTWAHGLITSLCFGHDRTVWRCGLSANCGQRWKARWNTGRQKWCRHGSHTGGVILQKRSKSLVRRDEAEKGKSASSKTMCRETKLLLVVRSRHR